MQKLWCAWFSAYLYFWFFKVFSIWNRWKGPIKDCLMAPKAQIHKNVSIVYGRYIKRLVARISDINEDSLLPKTLTNHLFSWHSEAIFGPFCIGIFIMIFSFSVVCLNTYFQILAYFWKKLNHPKIACFSGCTFTIRKSLKVNKRCTFSTTLQIICLICVIAKLLICFSGIFRFFFWQRVWWKGRFSDP